VLNKITIISNNKKEPGDGSLVLFLLLFVNSNKLTNLDKNKVEYLLVSLFFCQNIL